MPLFIDMHKGVEGLTAEVAEKAHKMDLEKQKKHGVNYLKYWYNEKDGTVFCLVDAPDKNSALKVHEEAHGLMPENIFEVKEGK